MNILLLEDDATELNILYTLLRSHWAHFNYTCCQNYTTAKGALRSTHYDIFILDIQLSPAQDELNGITFAQYIRSLPHYKTTPILFITCTSGNIHACINNVHCYSYLEKPYDKTALISAIQSILDTFSDLNTKQYLSTKLLNDVTIRILFSNIIFIEAHGHYLNFICSDGSFTSNSHTLNSIANLLPNYFIRCHRKYIVNLNYITSYDKTNLYIHLQNHVIAIGRHYKKDFEAVLYAQL